MDGGEKVHQRSCALRSKHGPLSNGNFDRFRLRFEAINHFLHFFTFSSVVLKDFKRFDTTVNISLID